MTRHVVFALVVAQPGRTFWATARLASHCGLQHRRPAKQASKAGPFLSYADGFAGLRARCLSGFMLAKPAGSTCSSLVFGVARADVYWLEKMTTGVPSSY